MKGYGKHGNRLRNVGKVYVGKGTKKVEVRF